MSTEFRWAAEDGRHGMLTVDEAEWRSSSSVLPTSGIQSGIGIELSRRYFTDGSAYCAAAEREASVPTLFDLTAPDHDA